RAELRPIASGGLVGAQAGDLHQVRSVERRQQLLVGLRVALRPLEVPTVVALRPEIFRQHAPGVHAGRRHGREAIDARYTHEDAPECFAETRPQGTVPERYHPLRRGTVEAVV